MNRTKLKGKLGRINNTNLNETITELANIKNTLLSIDLYSKVFINDDLFENLENIKQALLKSQEQEKVLEIIKKKDVDIQRLTKCINVATYNNGLPKNRQLTQEEFELLKEVLEND